MALTKTQKNRVYDELFNRMLRPSEANESDLVEIVESVVGTDKDIKVSGTATHRKITIKDGEDSFEVSLLSEVPTDIDGNFTYIQD